MRILLGRPTRRFVAVLVKCGCGRKFLHRLDRPRVTCLRCGRTDEMQALVRRLRLEAASVPVQPASARTVPVSAPANDQRMARSA
jgi:hypothetical protein